MLVRCKTKGPLHSVSGHYQVEAQVVIKIAEGNNGIITMLAGLWEYVALLVQDITGVPPKQFEAWVNSIEKE